MIILTKHCTVRLDRVSSLDRMINVGTFYLDPIYAQNNHVIDNNTVNISNEIKSIALYTTISEKNAIAHNSSSAISFHFIALLEINSKTGFKYGRNW